VAAKLFFLDISKTPSQGCKTHFEKYEESKFL